MAWHGGHLAEYGSRLMGGPVQMLASVKLPSASLRNTWLIAIMAEIRT
jgi:hypothetical protein